MLKFCLQNKMTFEVRFGNTYCLNQTKQYMGFLLIYVSLNCTLPATKIIHSPQPRVTENKMEGTLVLEHPIMSS